MTTLLYTFVVCDTSGADSNFFSYLITARKSVGTCYTSRGMKRPAPHHHLDVLALRVLCVATSLEAQGSHSGPQGQSARERGKALTAPQCFCSPLSCSQLPAAHILLTSATGVVPPVTLRSSSCQASSYSGSEVSESREILLTTYLVESTLCRAASCGHV